MKPNLQNLLPFLDQNGVLRVKGRLQKSKNLSDETKHPIILDGKNQVVQLMGHYYHVQHMHYGVETLLNVLKQRFYITKMRSVVKKIFYECGYCRKLKAVSKLPLMADFRVYLRVYLCLRQEKRCANSKAIHIDLAESFATDSAIIAIRCFRRRRSDIKVMYSDNGTNLRDAEAELKKAHSIDWRVNLLMLICNHPAAPHFGGVWERLKKTVKKSLYAVSNEKVPKEETLHTLLVKVEYRVIRTIRKVLDGLLVVE
jgi:hypothetical protein